MKIYKLDIDASKPTRQMLCVPIKTKYGLDVKPDIGRHNTNDLTCVIIDGDQTISPKRKDEDGTFFFEMPLGNEERDRQISVRLQNTPLVFPESTVDGTGKDTVKVNYVIVLPAGKYYPIPSEFDLFGLTNNVVNGRSLNIKSGDRAKSNVSRIILTNKDGKTPSVQFMDSSMKPMAADEPMVLTGDVQFGISVQTPGGRIITIPASNVGMNLNQSFKIILNEERTSVADYEIDDYSAMNVGNLSAETFSLSGLSYAPATIVVDGVEYKVLAANVE